MREQDLKRREEELRRKIEELLTVNDSIFSYPEVIQRLCRDEKERLMQQWEQLKMDKKNIKSLKNDLLWKGKPFFLNTFFNFLTNVFFK